MQRRQLWELMPVAAVLALMLVLVVWSGLAPTPRDGSARGFSASTLSESRRLENRTQAQPDPEPAASDERRASSVTPWLVLLGFAALGYLLWRIRPRSFETSVAQFPDPTSSLESSEHATDEVRRCYQRFLELARDAGLPRGNAETPLEFAARFEEQFGVIAAETRESALNLTRLYEPVRYGALAATRHALEAQSALTVLERNLRSPRANSVSTS